MDLRDLNAFELVANVGTVSRAAEMLGRTQPALTKCLQRLECEYDAKLFQREGRRLKLTESGQALLEQAGRIRMAAAQARQQITDLTKGASGLVKVGIGAPAFDSLLPGAIAEVLSAAPNVRFDLSVGSNDVLEDALLRGDLDLRIGPLPQSPHADLKFRFIRKEETIIAARHGHPLQRPGVTMADLDGAQWALPRPHIGSRQWLETLLQKHKLQAPRVAVETNLIQVQPHLIAASDLLTVIARRSLASIEIGELIAELPIPGAVLTRRFGAMWRRDAYLSGAAKQLIAALVRRGE